MGCRSVWIAGWLICLQLGCIGGHAAQSEQQPIVKIHSGLLEGIHFGSNPNDAAFLGVPYAAPPIGGLRCRPPQPVPKWNGTRKADNFGSPCSQLPAPWVRFIEGKPDTISGTLRGATGTTPWTHYEFELPVGKTASNINFGVLLTGTGTAWVDAMKVELDGEPYSNPRFDFDFESPAVKGFYIGCGGTGGGCGYKVGIDDTTSFSGRQSLKMQSVEAEQLKK